MSMSANMVRRQMGNRYQESRFQQIPRSVVHSKLFFYLMSVGFTGAVNESTTSFTQNVKFDALVRGAWSDLQFARARLKQTDSDWSYSVPQIQSRGWFGNSNLVNPYRWWDQPLFLEASTAIEASWLNVAGEGAGNCLFYSEKMPMFRMDGGVEEAGNQQVRVSQSQPYELRIDLGSTQPQTDECNNDLLIWGTSCNLETSNVVGIITSSHNNYGWSKQQVPIRGMCGVDGQPQPVLRFHNPYYLPANQVLILNQPSPSTTTGGFITFVCERILA